MLVKFVQSIQSRQCFVTVALRDESVDQNAEQLDVLRMFVSCDSQESQALCALTAFKMDIGKRAEQITLRPRD
ncbi:hypothetical protein AC629_29450 [Bradyrhizobium sp. NAS80.1]|nr:hypothetical protein AC629_29450 [Bradyrhizobium sp. NAS80.1]